MRFNALLSNTGGGSNTAIGANALQNNTTAEGNTANGFSALQNNTTGAGNTANGYGALQNNTTAANNTATGTNALMNNTTGFNNAAIGSFALGSNSTGCCNTAVGMSADVERESSNSTAIGYDTHVDTSNKIRLGNPNVTVIEVQVPYTFTSDRNQKEDFRSVDGEQVLNKIGGLSLTTWDYIGHDPKKFRHYGPVAQEFFAAFGHDTVGTIGIPTTINSGDMDGILMIAVQALSKRSEQHSKELEEENEQLESLRAENAALKAEAQAILQRLTAMEKRNLRSRKRTSR